MDFHVSLEGRGDLTARIYRELRAAVLDGRLRPGERLPATRELARSLAVSRNTVATAYERLTAEGFAGSRVGSGTYVTGAKSLVEPPLRTQRKAAGELRPRAGWTFTPAPVSAGPAPRFDFRVGIPDAQLFPFDTWRRLVASELRLTANSPGRYAEPSGHSALREAIARYVGTARSVRAHADDLLVTNGTRQALDLVGRVLISPGDVVAVEEPGYPPARDLFTSLGAQVVGVRVDGEGLVVDELPATARLVYTTPSHQFPLGMPMSLARRSALIAWATRHDAAVIEDDYDSEFRFSQRPLEPLVSLDQSGRVLYVGTFSETLLPALRTGFIVTPASLRPALAAARQLSDAHGPVPTQAALARFMDEGQLVRHVRRASSEYAGRQLAVVSALQRELGDLVAVVPSTAGLHVCARLLCGDAGLVEGVVRAAEQDGIALESLGRYCGELPRQAGFVIGYGGVSSGSVAAGIERFARLLRRELTVS